MKTEIFDYLDTIRETGSINMLSVTPYLIEMFDLTKQEARDILVEWINKNK